MWSLVLLEVLLPTTLSTL